MTRCTADRTVVETVCLSKFKNVDDNYCTGCRRMHAREKAGQAETAARKALESAHRARTVREHFSQSPTATSLTSNSQIGELITI